MHLRDERESEEGEGVEDAVENPSRPLWRRREEAAAAPLREAICGGVREIEKASAIGFSLSSLMRGSHHLEWLFGCVVAFIHSLSSCLAVSSFIMFFFSILFSQPLTKHFSAGNADLTSILCFSYGYCYTIWCKKKKSP